MIKSLLVESLLNEKSSAPRKALLLSTSRPLKPDAYVLKNIEARLASMFPSEFVSIRSEDDDWLDVTIMMKDFTLADAISNVKGIKAAMDKVVGCDTIVSILQ